MSASILDEIVASKRGEVATAEADAAGGAGGPGGEAPPIRDFRAALDGRGPIQLIAEVKKASPSVKVIREDFEPVAIARTYQAHGAACLSISPTFLISRGTCRILRRIRASVAIPLTPQGLHDR